MRLITPVGLLLSALAGLSACAHPVNPPPATVTAAASPAPTARPPAPVWPDAAPAPEAPPADTPGPDAATQMAPAPEKEFAATDQLPDVHFAPGRFQVEPAERRVLDAAVAWLKANPTHIVMVEGYTDAAGPEVANRILAQKRAAWVMAYLVGRGVAASRITVVSRGESGALCAERSAACQSRNRRVHFLVRDTSLQVTASPTR
ncbi:MAG TPA: OmpA family protein [Methylomirabilota bacterium]|nr:OmpA family protein [Methylomirabilota bacterium]